MKERIFSGWTFTRWIYFLMGGLIMMQSIIAGEWIGILFGGYFAAMGIFAFGCASGNCGVDTRHRSPSPNSNSVEDIEWEELKN